MVILLLGGGTPSPQVGGGGPGSSKPAPRSIYGEVDIQFMVGVAQSPGWGSQGSHSPEFSRGAPDGRRWWAWSCGEFPGSSRPFTEPWGGDLEASGCGGRGRPGREGPVLQCLL